MTDQLTLVHTEQKMRQLVNDLANGQRALAEARDAEVDAKHRYEAKRRRMLLSPDCPRVGRGADGVTRDVQAAWVEMRCEEEEHAYNLATVKREAAADHMWVLKDQVVLVTALSKSVQISMGLAGRAEPQWGGG